jgi:hypothetical protein
LGRLGEPDDDVLGRGTAGVPGVVGVPTSAAAGAGTPAEGGLPDDGEPIGLARSRTVRPPVTRISTALTVARPNRAIAPVAVAALGLSRTVLQRRCRVIPADSSVGRESAR